MLSQRLCPVAAPTPSSLLFLEQEDLGPQKLSFELIPPKLAKAPSFTDLTKSDFRCAPKTASLLLWMSLDIMGEVGKKM